MVANGKADVSLLNGYLKDYSDLIYGKVTPKTKQVKGDKKELMDHMEGFRALFGREKITFKPKVGAKLDGEIHNISLEELMKSEKN